MNQVITEIPDAVASENSLSADEFRKIDAYWRACNYLSLGMLYLCENPLLREPLKVEHLKKRLIGHWGSDPGQSFVWVHLNRLIKKYDLNMIYIAGPGHGAPATLANAYLEGTYSEVYPDKSEDAEGMRKILQAVLVSGRNRQPLHSGNARVPSTKAANWAIACPTLLAPLSTIPT